MSCRATRTYSVKEDVLEFAVCRVERGDEHGPAGILDGDAFSLHDHEAVRDRLQQHRRQVHVQQVDVVDVQNACIER